MNLPAYSLVSQARSRNQREAPGRGRSSATSCSRGRCFRKRTCDLWSVTWPAPCPP